MTLEEAQQIIKDELFNASVSDYQEGFLKDPEASAYRNGLRFALRTLNEVSDVNSE